jgi:hypothetical protein
MSSKTVTIDHPHAEVIAAYYSGKTVQHKHGLDVWIDWAEIYPPAFSGAVGWRIKPEPLVKWAVVFPTGTLWGVYGSREVAEREKSGNKIEHARIVRMVEIPE